MKDFVSNRLLGGVALVTALAGVWAVVVSVGLAGPALLGASLVACLAVSVACWLNVRAPRSISQVLDGVEGEPHLAVALAGTARAKGVAKP